MDEQSVDKYPYSDTVAELQKFSRLLEEIRVALTAIEQALVGQVPRYYIAKASNQEKAIIKRFFDECPPGGIKDVSLVEEDILSRIKKFG